MTQIRNVKKDGSPFWCLAHVSTFVHPEHGRMWISVLSDINERKLAEERIREGDQRFKDLVEYLPETVYEMDLAGNLTFVNQQAFANFGYSQDDFKRGLNGFDMIVPEDRGRAMKNARTILEGGHLGLTEYTALRKDGTTFPAMFHSSPVLRDGKPVGLIGFITDITERKEAELEIKLYAQKLEQSNRELEDFTFVASHDLNEPLRKIQAFGTLLKGRFSVQLGEEGRDYVARMENAASRMQKLLKALLNYSRLGTHARDLKAVDTTLIVQEAVNDLELLIQKAQGRVEIGPLPSLEADPEQLRQLFQNLIGNAVKFRRTDVTPIIKVYGWVQNESCQIFVEDNGIGFDETFFERMVKPFQRLHGRSEYEGMGMGLAICRKIVERHGGRLTAKSTPGEGSTFIVTLPLKRDTVKKDGPNAVSQKS
jgi:two-component system sensor kinase FixL